VKNVATPVITFASLFLLCRGSMFLDQILSCLHQCGHEKLIETYLNSFKKNLKKDTYPAKNKVTPGLIHLKPVFFLFSVY